MHLIQYRGYQIYKKQWRCRESIDALYGKAPVKEWIQSIALHKRKFGVDNETTAHIFLNFQKVCC